MFKDYIANVVTNEREITSLLDYFSPRVQYILEANLKCIAILQHPTTKREKVINGFKPLEKNRWEFAKSPAFIVKQY